MINAIPSTRHGVAGASDAVLLELSALAQRGIDTELERHLAALTHYPGQLWATWKDDASRSRFATVLDQAWRAIGESDPIVHLVPSDDEYDYQEDAMNNPDA